MRNPFTSVFCAGLLFPAAGCEPDDSPGVGGDTFETWDSAGIEIVESAAPAWGDDGWSIADSPSLVIGRMEGDARYLFGEVAGAVVLRDGRIAVLDGQSALIRVYSPEGDHIEDWGGHGEGPGEFDFPRRSSRTGATPSWWPSSWPAASPSSTTADGSGEPWFLRCGSRS